MDGVVIDHSELGERVHLTGGLCCWLGRLGPTDPTARRVSALRERLESRV